MRTIRQWSPMAITAISIALTIFLTSMNAEALDLYQDRRGVLSGIGLGGGFVLQDGSPGGGFYGDLQLGAGVTENLTINLDVDVWFQIMEDHRHWLINPGPELTYFFGESGVYARAGVAVAFVYTLQDSVDDDDIITGETPKDTDDNSLSIGGDFSLGVGYEFFMNSNVALDLGVEADYILVDGDDIINIGFNLGFRFY